MDEPLLNLLIAISGAISLTLMRYDRVPFGNAAALTIAGNLVLMIGWGLFDLARAGKPTSIIGSSGDRISFIQDRN
jgi:hypothetical protein